MDILDYIKNEIYFRVKPSSIEGVGLFAIKDIPEGTDIFREFWSSAELSSFQIEKSKLYGTHPGVVRMLQDYWKHDDKFQYFYLPKNYKFMHTYYINHSDNPNIEHYYRNDETQGVVTIRDILEGEEIVEDYTIYHADGLPTR